MKHLLLFFLLFSNKIIFCQNLVPNPSFETGPGTPMCQNSTYTDLSIFIDSWQNANPTNPCFGNDCKTSEWFDYSICGGTHPQPQISSRYMAMVTSEGIRVELAASNQNYLNVGHTYKLTFRFAAGVPTAKLKIYLARFGADWNANSIFSQNQKQEVDGVNAANISSFQTDTWITITKFFQVIPTNNQLKNLVFVADIGKVYLDDVELYDLGCCPEYKLYENTTNLPALTSVIDYIRAGNDAGIPNTSGNVTVLTGQNVTFKAGNQIILEPGFSVQLGATFNAIIDDCQSSSNIGNINVSFLPNVFTPNCDNINDNLCFTVTGADYYTITVFNEFGGIVHTSNGVVANNFVCAWDGICNGNACTQNQTVSDGTYFYIITFNNCSTTSEFSNFVQVFTNPNSCGSRLITGLSNLINNISIYPNPSTGIFTLQKATDAKATVVVYDVLGNCCLSLTLSQGEGTKQIDLTNFAKGIYHLQLLEGEKVYSQKIVLE